VEPNARVEVPTMAQTGRLGYARRDGFQAVSLPYEGGGFQFLILLPDPGVKLAQLEARLTPELLSGLAAVQREKVALFLPKFRIQPPTLDLAESLKKLGMRTAFDEPRGSANFERMAERKPDDYLFIGKVLHKTFLDLDENGTEAAAATAVAMMRATSMPVPENPPVEVRVDRPFLFAVQHRSSGACLFLGRITDPR
jgi:serpin B